MCCGLYATILQVLLRPHQVSAGNAEHMALVLSVLSCTHVLV